MSSRRARRRQRKRIAYAAAGVLPVLLAIAYAVSSNDKVVLKHRFAESGTAHALLDIADAGESGRTNSNTTGDDAQISNDPAAVNTTALLQGLAEREETLDQQMSDPDIAVSADEVIGQLAESELFDSMNVVAGASRFGRFANARQGGRSRGNRSRGVGYGLGTTSSGPAGFGGGIPAPEGRSLREGVAFDPLAALAVNRNPQDLFADIFDELNGDGSILDPWFDPCAEDGLVVSPCFRVDPFANLDPCAGAALGELVVSPCFMQAAQLLDDLDPPPTPFPPRRVPFFDPPPPGPPGEPPGPDQPPGPGDNPPGPFGDPPTQVPIPGSAFLLGLGLVLLRSTRTLGPYSD